MTCVQTNILVPWNQISHLTEQLSACAAYTLQNCDSQMRAVGRQFAYHKPVSKTVFDTFLGYHLGYHLPCIQAWSFDSRRRTPKKLKWNS